ASSVKLDGKGRLILYDKNRAITESLALAELSDVSIEPVGTEQLAVPVERVARAVCDSERKGPEPHLLEYQPCRLPTADPFAIVTGAPLRDNLPLIEGVQVRFDPFRVIVALGRVSEQEARKFQEGEIGLYLQQIDGLISLVVNVED